MTNEKSIAVLGGDIRQVHLAAKFAAMGFSPHVYGIPKELIGTGCVFCGTPAEAITDTAAVILPLPCSFDGIRLSLPLIPEKVAPPLSELLEYIPAGAHLFGGKIPIGLQALAAVRKIDLHDYFESEELQQKNALPTAEGALYITMRELQRVIKGAPVAVTGFGRVGKELVKLLLAVGADVTVAARRPEVLAEAKKLGCRTLPLTKDGIKPLAKGFTVLYNTVPARIFDRDFLSVTDSSTLIVDLASAPGGVDGVAAAARGIKVIFALSLPGKYAPVTAGEIIAESVFAEMEKEGIV